MTLRVGDDGDLVRGDAGGLERVTGPASVASMLRWRLGLVAGDDPFDLEVGVNVAIWGLVDLSVIEADARTQVLAVPGVLAVDAPDRATAKGVTEAEGDGSIVQLLPGRRARIEAVVTVAGGRLPVDLELDG